jgi:hypothetical protein
MSTIDRMKNNEIKIIKIKIHPIIYIIYNKSIIINIIKVKNNVSQVFGSNL